MFAHIPAEVAGKARAFFTRVAAENDLYLAASHRMVKPIKARLQRYPHRSFRLETLKTFEREWRLNMPQVFSIDYHAEWQRHGVTITERRISIADLHEEHWQEDYQEPQLAVGDVTATLNRQVAKVGFRTRAVISRHALFRRVQWGWDSGDASLIHDIAALAAVDPAGLPPREFVTLNPGWRGRAVEAEINGKPGVAITVRDWFDL